MAEPLTSQTGLQAVNGAWTWPVTNCDLDRTDEILLFRNGVAVPYASGELAVSASGVVYTPALAPEAEDLVWGTYPAYGQAPDTAPGQGQAGRAIRDRATALARLQDLVPINVAPTLSGSELDRCLDNALVAAIWAPSTAYQYGDRVVPTASNGQMYRCTVEYDATSGGTSDTEEPDWTAFVHWPGQQSAYVSDNTILWERIGPEPPSLWDLKAAARAGWLMKAAKATANVSSAAGKLKSECQQVYEHCCREAARYAPGGFV